MRRPQFTLRALLLLAGSVVAGVTTQRIASSMTWAHGKRIASLSLQGNALFCSLGAIAGFALTLAVLYSKPPAWVKANRLGPYLIATCALLVSFVAGGFALCAWYVATGFLPRGFYQFVIK